MDKVIRTSKKYKTFCDGTATNKFLVEADGTVRAFDRVGNIYTVCHSLSKHQQRMIRAEAAKQ